MTPEPSLLVATLNEGKLQELRQLLADLPLSLLGLDDFPTIQTVAETGLTFVENASLKASGYATQALWRSCRKPNGSICLCDRYCQQ